MVFDPQNDHLGTFPLVPTAAVIFSYIQTDKWYVSARDKKHRIAKCLP